MIGHEISHYGNSIVVDLLARARAPLFPRVFCHSTVLVLAPTFSERPSFCPHRRRSAAGNRRDPAGNGLHDDSQPIRNTANATVALVAALNLTDDDRISLPSS